jgi:hypothetical protein
MKIIDRVKENVSVQITASQARNMRLAVTDSDLNAT